MPDETEWHFGPFRLEAENARLWRGAEPPPPAAQKLRRAALFAAARWAACTQGRLAAGGVARRGGERGHADHLPERVAARPGRDTAGAPVH